MANLFDYLKWRGDISVTHDAFNEIDALILSEISYLDLSEFVDSKCSEGVTLGSLAKAFFSGTKRVRKPLGLIIPDSIFAVFKFASQTRRFSNMKVFSFVNDIDLAKRKQFSATAFDTLDRHIFIAFRGTDDTIVGWRENFSMSYSDVVPAQEEAKKYLTAVASSRPLAPIRMGGHSKGGNLAMYSALNTKKEIREQICAIYCFDGPGFSKSITEAPNYFALRSRIFSFVPENSVVGLLLSYDTSCRTVRSGGKGLYQHDAFTWKVNVNRFDILPESSKSNLRNAQVIKNWLDACDRNRRREFCESLFEILESTGAKTLTDLSVNSLAKAKEMIITINGFDKEKKRMISDVLSLLIKESILSKGKKYLIKGDKKS